MRLHPLKQVEENLAAPAAAKHDNQ